ncbi:MAG: Toxin-antitoxin biofilm protein TabA [Phycisphaerae bacterium]|nr:Toxin-antitoxin biofilm protein TabA [Phycisphaerae bacterium]
MIFDRIENARAYAKLGPAFARALAYLAETDFSKVPLEKQKLDGDRVFAIPQKYQPKQPADAKWEAHRKYIDIQFIVSGHERMGYAPLSADPPVKTEYNAEKDVIFFSARGDLLDAGPGTFAIFTPQDIHAPSIAPAAPHLSGEVHKIVVKVAVDEAAGPCGF